MKFTDELASIRDEVLKALAAAASASDTRRAVILGRTLEDLERDHRVASEIETRMERVKEDLAGATNGSSPANQRPAIAALGRKLNGNQIRREFAQTHSLQHLQGVIHLTSSGKSVGIATASEDPRGNRWWLGLPDSNPDVVVLICVRGERYLEFIIPRSALTGVWAQLSRDKTGNIKFNVKRAQGSYGDYELLVTGDSPLNLQTHLGNYTALR